MTRPCAIKVNDEVTANGNPGQFIVVQVSGEEAAIQLFGTDTKNGERILFDYYERIPLSELSLMQRKSPHEKLVDKHDNISRP